MITFLGLKPDQLSGKNLFDISDQGLNVVKTMFNLHSNNGSMINHFENAKLSFNQNSEILIVYSLIVMVSFIIGTGVYFLIHTKPDEKQ